MNAPRGRPDAEWIARVRAENRAARGMGQLAQAKGETPGWQALLVTLGVLWLASKLLPR